MERYSKEIANAILKFLTDGDWKFRFDEEDGLFRFRMAIDGNMKSVDCIMDVKENEYLVYAISPISGDSKKPDVMAVLAEFICRANYGLKNGNFEMDFRDGEIRYKTYVSCHSQIPGANEVERSIGVPVAMFQRYSPGILGIIFAGMDAEKAVEMCEK